MFYRNAEPDVQMEPRRSCSCLVSRSRGPIARHSRDYNTRLREILKYREEVPAGAPDYTSMRSDAGLSRWKMEPRTREESNRSPPLLHF